MEIPAGKIRAYESIYNALLPRAFLHSAQVKPLDSANETIHLRWVPVEEVRAMLSAHPGYFFPTRLNALGQYLAKPL